MKEKKPVRPPVRPPKHLVLTITKAGLRKSFSRRILSQTGKRLAKHNVNPSLLENVLDHRKRVDQALLAADLEREKEICEVKCTQAMSAVDAFDVKRNADRLIGQAQADRAHLDNHFALQTERNQAQLRDNETALQVNQERQTAVAQELKKSPSSTAKVKIQQWYLYPILALLVWVEAQTMIGAFLTTGMPMKYAVPSGYSVGIALVLLSKYLGKCLRQGYRKDDYGKWIWSAMIIGVCIEVSYGVGSMRAEFLAQETGTTASFSDTMFFATLNLLMCMLATAISYFSTHRNLELTKTWNALIDEAKELKAAQDQLHAQGHETKETYGQSLRDLHETYQVKVQALHDRADELLRQKELAEQEVTSIAVPLANLQAAISAQKDADFALATLSYNLQKGKQSRPRKSIWPFRQMSTAVMMLLMLVGFTGCDLFTGEDHHPGAPITTEMHVLVDRSTSFRQSSAPFTDADLWRLADLNSSRNDVFNGLRLIGKPMNGVFISREFRQEIKPADPDAVNPFLRKKQLQEWFDQVGGFTQALHRIEDHGGASELWIPVTEALKALARSSADRRILILSTDYLECSNRLCFADDKTARLLQDEPYSLVEQLETTLAPMPDDLTGIDVYMLVSVSSESMSGFAHELVSFWQWAVFEARGANVTVSANL